MKSKITYDVLRAAYVGSNGEREFVSHPYRVWHLLGCAIWWGRAVVNHDLRIAPLSARTRQIYVATVEREGPELFLHAMSNFAIFARSSSYLSLFEKVSKYTQRAPRNVDFNGGQGRFFSLFSFFCRTPSMFLADRLTASTLYINISCKGLDKRIQKRRSPFTCRSDGK